MRGKAHLIEGDKWQTTFVIESSFKWYANQKLESQTIQMNGERDGQSDQPVSSDRNKSGKYSRDLSNQQSLFYSQFNPVDKEFLK